jgi:hypothetical protein
VEFPHEIHDNFNNYQDTILLVDKGEKQVSNTVGRFNAIIRTLNNVLLKRSQQMPDLLFLKR